MILYFASRKMEILGQASTSLSGGYTVSDDLKTEDVETGVSTFSCYIGYNDENRAKLEEMTNAGNYLLRSNEDERDFFTIIDSEINTKTKEIYIYAEDAGLDLINEYATAYEADQAYSAKDYIEKYAYDSGFVIGINEIPKGTTRKLSWDGEESVTSRLASIATQFGGYEISYSFEVKGLTVIKKLINIHKKRGIDAGVTLYLNRDIDKIVTTKSVANLATALLCEGGIPEESDESTGGSGGGGDVMPTSSTDGDKTDGGDETAKPITFSSKGYEWEDEDGDFFIDGDLLKSRKANAKWSRYVWNKEPNKVGTDGGYIVRPYSYNTTDPETLKSHAVTELKKICDMEINYEIDIKRLPEGVKIGDRVNIVDDGGEMYVSTRILKLETSVANRTYSATLGENLIKTSGISQKIEELAARFAESSLSVERALAVAAAAKSIAQDALDKAIAAVSESGDSEAVAAFALRSADEAEEDADDALEAVYRVEEAVAQIEVIVENASTAAQNAVTAAELATAKAEEAEYAADVASEYANEAKSAADSAQTASAGAVTKADVAISTAGEAKTTAESATAVAQAAKADAEQAKADVAGLGETLETVRSTMQTDYARKTELTETEATLRSQISQNSAEISSVVSLVSTIDETANDAKDKAEAAQSAASTAEEQAAEAKAEAVAAQNAADAAALAASNAQSEADTAKAAAESARSVADKAESDLEAARADLATVSAKVDATEEEIAAAQEAVNAAQIAAQTAKNGADEAARVAANAQTLANSAVTDAANAQSAADIARQVADEAKGNATAAQTRANEAATLAQAAQNTANTAVTNAATAKAKADQAATDAAKAQATADAAGAKAAQAQTDLNTAKQNLADITSRVGATEEEVEAARNAVVTAQSAADRAAEEAEAAQATANTAKANATTAQSAANNARLAAESAQSAAEEARAAADKAQADVNSLAVRVTEAETDISQTSEQIKLLAKKTEVAEMLGGYSTKTETAAAIELKADEITSSVSGTYATSERVTSAESLIQQLSNCIAMLITDENGESLMTQSGDGWTFSMRETNEAVSGLIDALGALQTQSGNTKATVEVLQQAVSDHGEALEYVNVTTFENEPCIELGESDSDFKLLITNTRIMFRSGASVPTYINTHGLVTQDIEVKGEIVQGGFVMLNTSDGGWGLLWKGGNS